MGEQDLVGVWSADALFAPGAQSDDVFVFLPDGRGRYEILNWVLCSAELFTWEVLQPGTLRLVGDKILELSVDGKQVEESPASFEAIEVPYSITEQDTPVRGKTRVLNLSVEWAQAGSYGFARASTEGLAEPHFDVD